MATKRKPTKPVKAWAYICRQTGMVDADPTASRSQMRAWRPSYRHPSEWRIARVEIREVGR